jgi:TetR/AcrR family transcriptional regulator, transcriptional repressor for nem operon
MARTRTFDREAVLGAAGNAFRQRGYRDVSINELEKVTGLVSGSIYNAFGDKAGLFRAALDFYVHGFVRQRLEAFAGSDARLEDLEGLFLSVLEPPLADGFGCLVTNSIIEFGNAPGIASEGIAETLDAVRQAIEGVLSREIGPAAAPVEAMQLILVYHGILTLSRSSTSIEAMTAAVHAGFARLRALRNSSTR